MGLNLETLVTILVILIVAILADGVRRMLKERSSRLHLRIDPKAQVGSREPYQDSNPELPSGGARAIRKGERRTPGMGDLEQVRQPPPLVMEPEEVPAAMHQAVQEDMFATPTEDAPADTANRQQSQPLVDQSAGQAEQPAPLTPAADGVAAQEILQVLALHLVASAERPMAGRELLAALLEQGLRFGAMNIFHRHQLRSGHDELQFSMANALEPGTFDIDAMEGQQFRAVTFFLKLPGPSAPADALDRMLHSAQQLAARFQAELRDDQHSALSQQTISHLREKVRDFERRQRVAGV